MDKDGIMRTEDGKYVLTGIAEVDERVFEQVKNEFGYSGRRYYRHYRGWKNYSYNKTNYVKFPPKNVSKFFPRKYFGYDKNDTDAFTYQYQFEYQYNYKYHSPQPGRALHKLAARMIHYPYGGGYGKFSYYTR